MQSATSFQQTAYFFHNCTSAWALDLTPHNDTATNLFQMETFVPILYKMPSLESKQQQKSHHEAEQTHGLRQSKAQDSIGEKLLL